MNYFTLPTLHDCITYLIILIFVYGWYLLFFEQKFVDGEGNEISKKDWEHLNRMDKQYD